MPAFATTISTLPEGDDEIAVLKTANCSAQTVTFVFMNFTELEFLQLAGPVVACDVDVLAPAQFFRNPLAFFNVQVGDDDESSENNDQ
jgi:hypothetical protein